MTCRTALAILVALTVPAAWLAVPATAGASSGCEVLDSVADRAECGARAAARDAARAEVERRMGDPAMIRRTGAGAGADGEGRPRSAAWEQALEEASRPDLGALLEPRPTAAVVGLAWFLLAVRARRRRRPRVVT